MRRPNHRLVKRHRSYTVEEAATVLGVHRQTVRQWIRVGLRTSDERRPYLLLGHDLAEFLIERRRKNKVRCSPGTIYCVRCRSAKAPAGGMVDYVPTRLTLGNLVGICPDCGGLIYRRSSPNRLAEIRHHLDVRMPNGVRHIVESFRPSVSTHFNNRSEDD